MRKQIVWLPLLFTFVFAIRQQTAVRVRSIPTSFYNTSTPLVSSTTFVTSTQNTADLNGRTTNIRNTPSTETRSPPDTKTRGPPDPLGPPDLHDPPTGQAITHSTSCASSVATFIDSLPEIVYVTVDGSYEVTVKASGILITAPAIYETPLQACTTTILPKLKTQPTPQVSPVKSGDFSFVPPPPPTRPVPEILQKQTSTIVVTKKTPVPVVDSTRDPGPPLTFQNPKTDIGPTTGVAQNVGTSGDGSGNGNTPVPSSQGNGRDGPGNGNVPITSSSGGGSVPNGGGNGRPDPIESAIGGVASIASIINSAVNPPFVSQPQTSGSGAVLATPTIDGVPVTIGPTAVVIGSQTVVIPISSQAVVVAGSQTFTVRPSEIIGSSTTFRLAGKVIEPATITQAPSVVITAGVTATIGASLAIISGTTYRIGAGASGTTIVVNGQTISIGSDGIVFSGGNPTTFAPAMTIVGGYQIVVVNGLTVSVEQTQAVISGTTYRIGSGATTTVVAVGGTTITIGPSGVVLPSTTINPTSVRSIASTATSRLVSTGSTTSSSGGETQTSSNTSRRFNLSHVLVWLTAIFPIIFLAI